MPTFTIYYLTLSEKRLKSKGLGMVNICGREENQIVVEMMPIHQGGKSFPIAPPAGR